MKANRKFRDDDTGVANVVSTLMIIAIVVPLMAIMLLSFTGMVMKQIDMMETTAAILEDALVHLQETTGYEVHTGYGRLFEINQSINIDNTTTYNTIYLVGHKHEIKDEDGAYVGCYNYSGYYPLDVLPTELTDNVSLVPDGLPIKFKVKDVITYFKFVIPDAFAIWKDVSNDSRYDVPFIVVSITSNESFASSLAGTTGYGPIYTTVEMNMASVLEIEKRI